MSLLMLTSIMSFLGAFIPHIIKLLLSILFMESKEGMELQTEIIAIKREMSEISMVDEFARHARLQRKLNKLQKQMRSLASSHRSATLKIKMIATYTTQALVGMMMLYLLWCYKYEPVVVLPEDWLYPFGCLFQWPTGVKGGVSIFIWFIITGTVARLTAGICSV